MSGTGGSPIVSSGSAASLVLPTVTLEPLVEADSRVLVPKKGKLFREDGAVRVAIIRPCMSRGKRLGPKGLAPIYTPSMLEAHAGVFRGWPMFKDHLVEGLSEDAALQMGELLERGARRQRGIGELGGRVVESGWDPSIVYEDDEEYGFQPGGVFGWVIPQRDVREMVETDPELLHVSIHAWPTGARESAVPWQPSERGMLIEGIRSKPVGSVDWVIRPGAGGRVLRESEALAVSVLEHFYDAAADAQDEQHEEHAVNPDEVKALIADSLAEAVAAALPSAVADAIKPALEEQEQRLTVQFEETLTLAEEQAEQRALEIVEERDRARQLERVAHEMIREAEGLTPRWREEILGRYSVLPSGPSQSLLVEGDDDRSDEDVLREAVKEDVEAAIAMIEESRGGPAVRGQGAIVESESAHEKRQKERRSSFREFMQESGDDESTIDNILEGAR